MIKKIRNYFYTLKALKFIQIINRIGRRFYTIKLNHDVSVPAVDFSASPLCFPQYNQRSLFLDGAACFLNETVMQPKWNDEKHAKLWLYNLHYFDDLMAHDASERVEFHRALITRWINENPALLGNGWEPYPLSLRLVNWFKWLMAGNALSETEQASLSLQSYVLLQSLEYHLLGNHLFANAKALLFAGCFFQGQAADNYLAKAEKILLKELDEQFLADGANFELSPMYHAILLHDCLDMLLLSRSFPDRVSGLLNQTLQALIPKQLNWLAVMTHDDSELSFFNDSAMGIATKLSDLERYAEMLELKAADAKLSEAEFKTNKLAGLTVYDLSASGYAAVKSEQFSLLVDLAEIGPSYIAGHAHADTLSFEFSLDQQRIFVNSGISEYGLSAERLLQRETSTHNTVSVNGLNSTEVWSGFRVARRASITQRDISIHDDSMVLMAEHNGFIQQGVKCSHRREFIVKETSLTISDELTGSFNKAEAFFILHPSVEAIQLETGVYQLKAAGRLLRFECSGDDIELVQANYFPEFGVAVATKKFIIRFNGASLKSHLIW